MSRYVTPLPGLLAGAMEQILNQALHLDPDAARLLGGVRGGVLKLELAGLNIDLYFSAGDRELNVTSESGPEAAPETTIAGTPAALLSMAVPELAGPGSVQISGDASLAQSWQKLFKQLEPDWEAGLSTYFGDLIGPQIYRLLLQARRTSTAAARTGADQLSRWLRDESELVPNREEWNEFSTHVDRLREAVDRLESRVRKRGP